MKHAFACLGALTLFAAPAAAQNLVLNGDFSNGLEGWNAVPGEVFGFPVGWTWNLGGYAQGAGVGDLTQSVTLAIGQTYKLEFDYQKRVATGFEQSFLAVYANYYQYSWRIADSYEVSHFSAEFVALSTPPSLDVLEFDIRYISGFLDDVYRIDNVSLTRLGDSPGVPEPANWASFIAGFGLAGAALRSRKRTLSPQH